MLVFPLKVCSALKEPKVGWIDSYAVSVKFIIMQNIIFVSYTIMLILRVRGW